MELSAEDTFGAGFGRFNQVGEAEREGRAVNPEELHLSYFFFSE
jgi:hypothetical protein